MSVNQIICSRKRLYRFKNIYSTYTCTTVRYKASKIWNKLPSSLKEFFSVKHFSSKLKEFLQVADIDRQYYLMYDYGRFWLSFII